MKSRTATNQIISAVQPLQVERVSVASDGTEANEDSSIPSISADGRFLAYSSLASNLVPGDTNDAVDVFVFDRQTDTTTRVSVASDGTEANEGSKMGDDILRVSITADGRFVAYASQSSNLVPGDTNDTGDIFVFDRQTGTTTRVSVASDGTEANDSSRQPTITADGRFLAYSSLASNLVPGDTNNTSDIFLFDRQTGTTTLVSVASDGTASNGYSNTPSISADGRFVTYTSDAFNLVPGDTNEGIIRFEDVFVFDRQTNTTELVSVSRDGTEQDGHSGGNVKMSADGRFVVYTSSDSNLVSGDTNYDADVFVFDRQTNTIQRVSVASDGTEANGFFSGGGTISADGRFVAYTSDAPNLVPGDTNDRNDVFVFDRQTNTTKRVSVASDGTEGNALSISGQISADGQYVAYWSDASNLVPGDTNGVFDIFVVQTDIAPPVDGVVKDGDDGGNILKGTRRDDILRGHEGKDALFGLKGDDAWTVVRETTGYMPM